MALVNRLELGSESKEQGTILNQSMVHRLTCEGTFNILEYENLAPFCRKQGPRSIQDIYLTVNNISFHGVLESWELHY